MVNTEKRLLNLENLNVILDDTREEEIYQSLTAKIWINIALCWKLKDTI